MARGAGQLAAALRVNTTLATLELNCNPIKNDRITAEIKAALKLTPEARLARAERAAEEATAETAALGGKVAAATAIWLDDDDALLPLPEDDTPSM